MFEERRVSFHQLLQDDSFRATLAVPTAERYEAAVLEAAVDVRNFHDSHEGALTSNDLRQLHHLRNFKMYKYADQISEGRVNSFLAPDEKDPLHHLEMSPIDQIYPEMELLDRQVEELRLSATTVEDDFKIAVFQASRFFALHPFVDGNKRLFKDAIDHFTLKEFGGTINWSSPSPGLSAPAVWAAVRGNDIGPMSRELCELYRRSNGEAPGMSMESFAGRQLTAFKVYPEITPRCCYTAVQQDKLAANRQVLEAWMEAKETLQEAKLSLRREQALSKVQPRESGLKAAECKVEEAERDLKAANANRYYYLPPPRRQASLEQDLEHSRLHGEGITAATAPLLRSEHLTAVLGSKGIGIEPLPHRDLCEIRDMDQLMGAVHERFMAGEFEPFAGDVLELQQALLAPAIWREGFRSPEMTGYLVLKAVESGQSLNQVVAEAAKLRQHDLRHTEESFLQAFAGKPERTMMAPLHLDETFQIDGAIRHDTAVLAEQAEDHKEGTSCGLH